MPPSLLSPTRTAGRCEEHSPLLHVSSSECCSAASSCLCAFVLLVYPLPQEKKPSECDIDGERGKPASVRYNRTHPQRRDEQQEASRTDRKRNVGLQRQQST